MSYANRARVQHLIDLNRPEEARDLARSFLAEDPQDASMISMLADAEYKTDGPAVALATIERAIALEHTNGTFHAQRGYFTSNLGHHDKADEAFATALMHDPRNSYALSAHVEAILRDPATSRRRKKAPRLALAESRVQSLLHSHPHAAITHLMDSKVRLAHNEFEACDAAARRALEIEPNNPIAHQLVGLAAEAMGDTRTAGDAYVSAQKADPTSSTGLEGLRRLGQGAALPIGFGLFIALRMGVRVGRYTSGLVGVLIVVALLAAAGGFIYYQRNETRRKAEAKLSQNARQILDQDRKFG